MVRAAPWASAAAAVTVALCVGLLPAMLQVQGVAATWGDSLAPGGGGSVSGKGGPARAQYPAAPTASSSAAAWAAAAAAWPWYRTDLPLARRAALLVAAMTPAERAAQLIKEEAAIPRLGLPAYSMWCEAAHGVAGSGRATVYPASIARAAAFDRELEWQMAQEISQEARAKHENDAGTNGSSTDGFAVTLYAPVVNLVRDGRWGRAQETFGEDPYLSSQLGIQFVRGVQVNESAPQFLQTSGMAKHFVAYNLESNFASGGDDGNYRTAFDANLTHRDFVQDYSPMFRSLVEDGDVATIMCSYNAVNGTPMCASPLLKSFLREQVNFTGTIFSDGGAVSFITTRHNYTADKATAAAVALNASVDLNSGGAHSDFGYLHLGEALQRGLITEAAIETAVTRVMTLRLKLAMFDPPTTAPFRALPMSVVDSPSHRNTARLYATRSLVMLKNTEALVPLSNSTTKRVSVIGPNANRTAALLSNYAGCREPFDGPITPSCTLVTPLHALQQYGAQQSISVEFSAGSDLNVSIPGAVAAAVEAAKQSDVAIVVLGLSTSGQGNDVVLEAEAHDRCTLYLPNAQQELLDTLCISLNGTVPIVLVMMSGGPVSIPSASSSQCVGAIIHAGYGGEEQGSALVDVLFRGVPTSGRLPLTVPLGDHQLVPDYYNLSLSAAPGRTYRYFTEEPLFAFGFGMRHPSVTVSYRNLAVSPSVVRATQSVTVSVTVTNTGSICTDEIVQLYAAYNATDRFVGQSAIPLVELKGFQRINDICPQQSQDMKFSLSPQQDLALVRPDGSDGPLSGQWTLWVGSRSPQSPGKYVKQTAGVPDAPTQASLTVMT